MLDWIKDGIPLANHICITVWFPFFSFSISHQLVRGWFDLQIRQRSKKKKNRSQNRCEELVTEVLVPVERILWKSQTVCCDTSVPLNRNENRSRLTQCQLRLFCSEITWHIICTCCCKQGGEGEKKIPIEKIITSLCHHPEGTLSVCVHWIILHVFERWGCFGWDPNWEQSVFTAYFFWTLIPWVVKSLCNSVVQC